MGGSSSKPKELTAEDHELLESTPVGITPNSQRKCQDWPFALLFGMLMVFVIAYGIDGIKMMTTVGFCDRVIEGNPPLSAGPEELYDNCLTYLVRGDDSATSICTTWGISKAMGLTSFTPLSSTDSPSSTGFHLLSAEEGGPSSFSSPYTSLASNPLLRQLARPVLPSGKQVREALTLGPRRSTQQTVVEGLACLSLLQAGETPGSDCIKYALSLGLGADNAALTVATLIWDECFEDLVTSVREGTAIQSSSIKSCVVLGASVLPSAPPVPSDVQQLLDSCEASNSASPESLADCFVSALVDAGTEEASALAAKDTCFLSALSVAQKTSPSLDDAKEVSLACLQDTLNQKVPADVVPRNFFEGCVSTMISNTPGASIQCALSAGQLGQLGGWPGPQDIACLGDLAMNAEPSEECIEYGVELAMGEGQLALYTDCVAPLRNSSTDGLLSCADLALRTVDASLAGKLPGCLQGTPLEEVSETTLNNCFREEISKALDRTQVDEAMAQCLSPVTSILKGTLPGEQAFRTAAGCLGFSAPSFPQRAIPFVDVLSGCLVPLLDGTPFLRQCAEVVGIDVGALLGIPQEVASCLSFAAGGAEGPPPEECVLFALNAVLPGSFTAPFYTNCIQPLLPGTEAAAQATAQSCGPWAVDLKFPGAGQVYTDCQGRDNLENCVSDGLDGLGVDTTKANEIIDGCIRYLQTPDKTAASACSYFAVGQIWGPSETLDDLWTGCLLPLINQEPQAVSSCAASFGGIGIPLPGGVQEAIDQCLKPLLFDSVNKYESCGIFSVSKVLKQPDTTVADSLWNGCLKHLLQASKGRITLEVASSKCSVYAVKAYDDALGSRVEACFVGEAGGTAPNQAAVEACVEMEVDAVQDKATKGVLNNCALPAVRKESGAPDACLQIGLQEAGRKAMEAVGEKAEEAGKVVNRILDRCLSPWDLDGCFREGLLTLLDSAGIFEMIVAGINKVIPASNGLGSECVEKLITAPKDSPTCLVDELLKLGVDFALDAAKNAAKDQAKSLIGFSVEEELLSVSAGPAPPVPPLGQDQQAHEGSHREHLQAFRPGGGAALGRVEGGAPPSALREEGSVQRMELQVYGVVEWAGLGKKVCVDLVEERTDFMGEWYSDISDVAWLYRWELSAIFLYCLGMGVVLAIMWMAVVSKHAEKLIKYAICLGLCNYLVMMSINFAFGNIPGATIIAIFFVLKCLWYCWVRGKLQFAASVLRVSLASVKGSPGPFALSVSLFFVQAGWCILFAGAAFRFYVLGPDAAYSLTKRFGEVFMVLSFFWATEVIKNVLAVSISGFVGMWYYKKPDQRSLLSPTLVALKRALTYSFGTICFGSVIVALLQTFEYLFKKAKKTKKEWLRAILLCIIKCLIKIIQMFNMYAFVQVATHGKSYCGAAKDTFRLMRFVGMEAIVNDDIVDGILSTGRWIGALALMGTAGVLTTYTYELPGALTAWAMVLAFLFGFVIMMLATVVVEIAAATLFVLFAIDPHALQETKPKLYEDLKTNWLKAHKNMPQGLSAARKQATNKPLVKGSSQDVTVEMNEMKGGSASAPLKSREDVKRFTQLVQGDSLPQLRKYPQSGKMGMSHMRAIKVDGATRTICWNVKNPAGGKKGGGGGGGKEAEGGTEGGSSTISFEQVRELRLGATTEGLKGKVKKENWGTCFSVHTDTREVNLQAASAEEAALWVGGLHGMIWPETTMPRDSSTAPATEVSKCVIC